ncbi:protein fantom-like isoform X3 [Astyanax mexicanus]|uniref:Protein fantom-like isoform X3 n=1 Tax=Astyanax mexicanus TaxID=7994 RepID=A0A8T2MNG2_ASTMX|nr:protein fantom-like isoform X3 [Astyanax mexicanus]
MSLTMDETAGDLPVRDVGLRGGAMIVTQEQETRSWKRPAQVLSLKERQRVFKVPREHLEEQCLRLQEENTLLKQHTRIQEQKLRRLSTKLLRLRYGHPGSAGGREADTEDTIQELETRVATLEGQKEALQGKLSVARQQILSLTGRPHHRPRTARGVEVDGGVRRAAQTAPARYAHSSLEDTREEIEKFRSSVLETQNMRVTELELAAQSLRDTLKEKEREIEDTVKELRRQQVDGHRLSIKENVDVIRLQKQLSEKSTALLVLQEKFTSLQEVRSIINHTVYIAQDQKSLRESQGALLGKVEELSEQLKEEKQRVLMLEGQLSTAALSLQSLQELQEKVTDLEGERNLLKKGYDTLLESTLSAQSHQEEHEDKERERERRREEKRRAELQRLEEILEQERRERDDLEIAKERMRREHERTLEEREQENRKALATELSEVLQHKQEAASLQEKLSRVTQEFDMSVEDLSETLMQIKAFRLQLKSQEGLRFLVTEEKMMDSSQELSALQASHAETVVELHKTQHLLLMQHRLCNDLQAELKLELERAEMERQENRKWATEKDKLLKSRALQINSLQGQLKDFAYSPRNYNRAIPQQYTWTGVEQEVMQPMEENTSITLLREGESLLEIHLLGATFTPVGLRTMKQDRAGDTRGQQEVVTFCTYAFLDFEMHSTPLISGSQPNYGFTSSYTLSAHDLTKLGGQGASVHAELHQALGGVQFITRGRARIPLEGVLQRRGEQIKGRANLTGSEGEILGVLEFWVRLHPQIEPKEAHKDRATDRTAERWATHKPMDWSHIQPETQEIFDYGGGIPNELEVVLERCVGLSSRWPGLLPDSYLTYRLYDLPPHSTPTVLCCEDPVFSDSTTYPLAVTADLMEYLKVGSLWVYVFDDSEGRAPQTYLAKTPVPLQPLAAGRPIKGDYVLRDPAGAPRGTVRVQLQWRYPFQTPEAPSRPSGKERRVREEERLGKTEHRTEVSHRPIAKPRLKTAQQKLSPRKDDRDQFVPRPPPIKIHRPDSSPAQSVRAKPLSKVRPKTTRSPDSDRTTDLRSPVSTTSSYQRRSASDTSVQDVIEVEEVEEEEEEQQSASARAVQEDSDIPESEELSGSDVIIIPQPPKPIKKGDRLRVEILSLLFDPSSSVALDQSVQQVYVEYRLLGIPMETTETPMSLRKPTKGEEVHYNFSRVIHVDSMEAAPLRHYLYTMLEGTDPNSGRLKFTVVSEPLNDEDECEDVGQAYLDLQELLLTGNDVVEKQIDIISMDEEQELVGKLRVSLEAAQALTGIYWEYHDQKEKKEVTEETEDTEENEEEEEAREEPMKKGKKKQVADLDVDDDSF